MGVQNRYWQHFTELKRDAIYIGKYHLSVEDTDRLINMFLAVASSASIGAWAVWQDHEMVWGAIIAVSQVLTAVKHYLPYKARLKGLSGLHPELEALAIGAENDWHKVSAGALEEATINDLVTALQRQTLQATKKHFPDTSLPQKKRLLDAANREATAYMERFRGE